MTATELAECRHSVDLRMIDFARSTHGGHYDQIEYDGLDECYLTGLSSLLKIFREMAEDKTTWNCVVVLSSIKQVHQEV